MSEKNNGHHPAKPKTEFIAILLLSLFFIGWSIFTWINLTGFEEGNGQAVKMNKYLVYLYNWGGKVAVCGFMVVVAIGLAIFAGISFKKSMSARHGENQKWL